MGLSFKILIPSLALVFSVAATGCESKTDKARKPGLVDSLVNQSVMLCDTGSMAPKYGAPYAQRLRKVLLQCTTKDLALYKNRNIVIALDQRLAKQKIPFFSGRLIEALYYNGSDKTLALWDDGRIDNKFMGKSTMENSREVIHTLAEQLRNDKIPPGTDLGIAGEYSYTTGSSKSRTTHYEIRWGDRAHYSEASVKKNEKILATSPRGGQSAGW